ncbi:hypothetical protein AVEN_143892-1 [Araneus ventricosus]|uniref:Uncharacterized protein n=1 Tax=Araneus ventricosus TaxID=182803 RepID=A0A4Y2S956_ARAVE|nr:hypothetical protein AVEN_150446-1 [Araneus ventricosus]GBN84788.1 hypothetical protein AVEN_143892-1 [Araneus ventricosus]
MVNRDSSVKSRCPTALVSNCDVHVPNAIALRRALGTKTHKQQVVLRTVLLHAVCSTQFGGIWAFLQQHRAATPAVALLVSSGVWHIATGSDCLPLW